MCYRIEMVPSRQHYDDPQSHCATIRVTNGGKETPLSAVRSCGMGVSLNKALDMNRSLHLSICFLLRDEYRELGV